MDKLLNYIIQEPKKKDTETALLLMLHGYGSNEFDLFSFAPELPDNLLIVSARAPLSLGYGGYAWYSLQMDSQNNIISNTTEALEARKRILDLVTYLQKKYSFNPKKSFLMGFSQGSILSYDLSLSYPDKINNIIALSGYINEDITKINKEDPRYKKLNFFCSHGTEDTVIPVSAARKTDKLLTELGINHLCKEYNTGHGVSPQNFSDFNSWLLRVLQK